MISAVIVAAGQGRRVGGDIPKQYLDMAGKPVLAYSLQAFDNVARIDQLIIVVAGEWVDHCRDHVVAALDIAKPVILITGGSRRQDSVFNGLKAIRDDKEDDIVLIHDGARPMISPALIDACIEGALTCGACVPGIPPVDTLKKVSEDGFIKNTIPRDICRQIQTPQAFQLKLIRRAHEAAMERQWEATDDAALIERLGQPVQVIPGESANLKITNRRDLILAEACYKNQS
jgi:2-C-methyl-D-erythritol 4-phosphate cytidylyltransferase